MAAGQKVNFRIHRLLKRSCREYLRRRFSSSASCHHNFQNNDTKQTHFGFQTVSEEEKEQKVYEVFTNVAEKYDLMNDAMSVGIHRIWKDTFVRKLSPSPGIKMVDVAGGTGDIAFRCLDYINSRKGKSLSNDSDMTGNMKDNIVLNPDGQSLHVTDSDSSSSDSDTDAESHDSHVTVCDINQSMLDVGKERALQSGRLSGISWVQGNAEILPFSDGLFDAYTIAFGIRNCTHVDQVVREAHRVLKPGGRFMCLEFSHVTNPLVRSVYDDYSFQIIPVMGQILAADWQSYQYLVESIRQFPDQEEFKDIIKSCGFSAVTYENLTFGIVAIHSGFKL